MKIGFVTCVQLGLSCMDAIYQVGGNLSFAASLPDQKAINKSGRVYIDNFCLQKGIPLLKTPHINDKSVVDAIRAAEVDWLFIIGWSQIANMSILRAPKCGVIGAHPTLLPIGRGRAAIPWAILKSLPETGVTLFKMDEGIDTGPILAQQVIELSPFETATTLYDKVNNAHIEIIRNFIPNLRENNLNLIQQDESIATIWPSRSPEDGKIDLSGSVLDAERLVRAVTHPYPGAYYYEGEKKIVVWKASAQVQSQEGLKFLKFKDGFLKLIDYDSSI